MVNKNTDPFGFSEGAKMALAQTHQAMDIYFDFLKKFISAFPSGGTEIGDRWKEQSLLFPIDCNCPCATIAALYPGQNTPLSSSGYSNQESPIAKKSSFDNLGFRA